MARKSENCQDSCHLFHKVEASCKQAPSSFEIFISRATQSEKVRQNNILKSVRSQRFVNVVKGILLIKI